ncbi:MAG: hypothetical protein NUV93_07320, partial [Firmicutes bacterium]|nr:hypothetical protein [Bacillota bacterium]
MSKFKYRFQMYKHLQANMGAIYAEAAKAADDIGIPAELRGKFGLTGAISGCPAPMRRSVAKAAEKGGSEVLPLSRLVEEIREIVKDVYGDDFDACPVNTCEAGLWVAFDCLFTPPSTGRGDNYRTRYVVPLEKHMHHHAGYGRPYPPKYKDFLADRGCTAGEMGFYGKRLNNLDAIIVPLPGAVYANHGIKYWPVPLLTGVNADDAIDRLSAAAEDNAAFLAGFSSLGYDTPGYGYVAKDDEGTPLLQKYLGELAGEFNVPYVVDNAWGLPFVGMDPRKVKADAVVYSMDKASGAATSGLIIGREEIMVPIRRALGMHGERWGAPFSYGKAAYVTQDPGKEALLTQAEVLKELRDRPESFKGPVDELYKIVTEELEDLPAVLKQGLLVTKSYNSGAVEINYEKTWAGNDLGFPIFTIE